MRSRRVYSTEANARCPKCGWPADSCRCSGSGPEPVPDKITAKLRKETSGRRGKAVTVLFGLPRNPSFLKQLAKELRKRCGSGGTAREDRIEIQGDHREVLRRYLAGKGWEIKG